jgi:hypothetical protein
MIGKIIEATFPSAASINFHISSACPECQMWRPNNTGRSIVRWRRTGGIRASSDAGT